MCNPFYQHDLTKKSTLDFSNRCKKNDTIETSCYHTPCSQVANPQNSQLAAPSIFFTKKIESFFLLIDHPAHSIDRGEWNQKELLASPDSPSPCALLASPPFPVGREGEALHQSHHNVVGAKWGKIGVLLALIPWPNCHGRT